MSRELGSLSSWDSDDLEEEESAEVQGDHSYKYKFVIHNFKTHTGLVISKTFGDDEEYFHIETNIQPESKEGMVFNIVFFQFVRVVQLNVTLLIENASVDKDYSESKDVMLSCNNSIIKISTDLKYSDIIGDSNFLTDGNLTVWVIFKTDDSSDEDSDEVAGTNTSNASTAYGTYTSSYSMASSKEATGYVGLKNQGATCYMNSMLQSLFHTPAFRRIVYQMPTTGSEDQLKSIPLNLQRLFAQMQTSSTPPSTHDLTVSFGWSDYQTIVQHDVQEFCRVLIDNLEEKTKGTALENSISGIFRGKYRSYIRCINVDYHTERDEFFYDLSLVVKSCPTLQKSFEKYIEKETLTGDNQYETEQFGKQDAEMGVEFLEFPSVLHLHLRRFEFDLTTERMSKINDRFEFPPEIDLSPYLVPSAPRAKSDIFDLYGVLVHSGSVNVGHYYAFLRTSTEPQWFEFNDSTVILSTAEKAIQGNYGKDTSTPSFGASDYSFGFSGYFLIYVRRADAPMIFSPIPDDEIPLHLRNYLNSMESMKSTAPVEKRTISIYPDSCISLNLQKGLNGFISNDLVKNLDMDGKETDADLYAKCTTAFEMEENSFRLWELSVNSNPISVLCPQGLSLSSLYTKEFFLQKKPKEESLTIGADQYLAVVMFFDATLEQPIQFLGTKVLSSKCGVAECCKEVFRILEFESPLIAYEECLGGIAKKLSNDWVPPTYDSSRCRRFVFQLEAGKSLPSTCFQWSNPIASTVVQKKDSEEILSYSDKTIVPSTYDAYESFVHSSVIASVYDYTEPRKLLLRVSFPNSILASQLTEFLSKTLAVPTGIVYKKDSYRDSPESMPLQPSSSLQHILPKTQSEKDYTLYFLMSSEEGSRMSVAVGISDDAKSSAKLYRFLIPYLSKVETLVEKVREKDPSINLEGKRILGISYNCIISILEMSSIVSYNIDMVRFEDVPEPQKKLSEGEAIVYVENAAKDYYLIKALGEPFCFVIKKDDTVQSFKSRLGEEFKIAASELSKIHVCIGRGGYSPQVGEMLKPTDKLFGITDDKQIGAPKTIFVVHPASNSWYGYEYSQQALKIYN